MWISDLGDEKHFLKVNFWNWRPTVALMAKSRALGAEQLERMSNNGCGGQASQSEARQVAQHLREVLKTLELDERVLLDGTKTSVPDTFEFHKEEVEKNHSATHKWLWDFVQFCETCEGFAVN